MIRLPDLTWHWGIALAAGGAANGFRRMGEAGSSDEAVAGMSADKEGWQRGVILSPTVGFQGFPGTKEFHRLGMRVTLGGDDPEVRGLSWAFPLQKLLRKVRGRVLCRKPPLPGLSLGLRR